ncbi:hypothetical protein [Microbacterium sp. K24]|uniref:hypothetical protein n=1 Tax=Microbacterium sp. K24 TaxID=2305446 RepID=UPI00109D6A2C|nr:hypothetical protein [Microbacterium sp. K24]
MGGLVIETIRAGVQFTREAAAAFRRANAQVRAEFGRDIDVNSTYRSWDQQMLMHLAWLRYVASGYKPSFYPGHSKAVHPSESFHVSGTALDSDDWRNARIVQILAENGFIRNRLYVKGEDHHFEYIRAFDRHIGEPAGSGGVAIPAVLTNKSKEDDMPESMAAYVDGVPSWCWLNWGTGALFAVHTQAEADWIGKYMGSVDHDWFPDPIGGDLYKNKLALFGKLCPTIKVAGASLTQTDLDRIKAMLAAGSQAAVAGAKS